LSTEKPTEEAAAEEETLGRVSWVLLMIASIAGVAAFAVIVVVGVACGAFERLWSKLRRKEKRQDPGLMRVFLPHDRRGV
jgi:hypothetical protein